MTINKSLTINHNKSLFHLTLVDKLCNFNNNTDNLFINIINSNFNYSSCENPLANFWFHRFHTIISEIEFYYGKLSNKNKKKINNWLETIIVYYI
jgi:hypothetical protein